MSLVMLSDYTLEPLKVQINSADGVVYRGVRNVDNVPVAVKFNLNTSPVSVARFTRENSILFDLAPHAGIVQPFTSIQRDIHEGVAKDYYAMELAQTSVENWMYTPDSTISAKKISVFIQVCEALQYAHLKGYVHRDLHLRNILMNIVPSEQIKLIDFGRAYDFNNPSHLSDPEPIWGNLVMPPEVRIGAVESPVLDDYVLGDIYALGVLWKVLFYVGHTPITDLFSIINETNAFIASTMVGQNPSLYYQVTTIDERKRNYSDWLLQESSKHTGYYDIPLVDVDFGIKVSNIAKKLLNFDASQRVNTIEDVLIMVRGL